MILNSPTISGSLTVTGNIITSGSITLSGSVASASYALNSTTAATASYANAFTVAGTLTAQTLVVQTITSSVDFVTGSTRFGSIIGNTHQFTGSVGISGNVAIGISTTTAKLHVNGGYAGFQYNSGLGTYPAYDTYYSAIGHNFSNGGSEMDIWNTVGGGFVFRKQTGASDQTALLYIKNDGNVGIGTTTPTFGKLSIYGTDNTTISSALWGTSTGAGLVATVYNGSTTNDSVAGIRLVTRNSGASVWNIYNISRGNDAGDLAFGNGSGGAGTEKIRITNTGNLGIGTNSPLTTLTVKSTNDNGIGLTRPSDASTYHWRLSTTETGGDAYTVRYNTFNNDMLFTTYNAGGTGGNIIFRNGTSSGNETEKFRITNTGRVGINNSNPLAPLHIASGGNSATIIQTGSQSWIMFSKIIQSYGGTSNNPLLVISGFNNTGVMIKIVIRGTNAVGNIQYEDVAYASWYSIGGGYQNSTIIQPSTVVNVAGTHGTGTLNWGTVSTTPTLRYSQANNGYILESFDIYVTARDSAVITFNTDYVSAG